MLTFPSERIANHITRIFAFGTELMYLIEGEEKNLLLDTGSGFGSLFKKVQEILKSHGTEGHPLVVWLSHGHVDHAMGAEEFLKAGIPVWMNREDDGIFRRHADRAFRLDSLGMEAFQGHGTFQMEEDYIPSARPEDFHDLRDGDALDLGGITVTAFACPGHTKGSMMFLIEEQGGERILFTGDACNSFMFLFQDYSESVEEYAQNLKTLTPRLAGRYDRVLYSHGSGEGSKDVLQEVADVCETILQGEAKEIPFTFGGDTGLIAQVPDREGRRGDVVYSRDRIWKKDTVAF
jgi:hydroxyacylglutathione hydrolase